MANDLACKGLDRIEKSLPILHQPSEQVSCESHANHNAFLDHPSLLANCSGISLLKPPNANHYNSKNYFSESGWGEGEAMCAKIVCWYFYPFGSVMLRFFFCCVTLMGLFEIHAPPPPPPRLWPQPKAL